MRVFSSTGKLQIANAGMPDPYPFRTAPDRHFRSRRTATLGARNDIRYDSAEVQLQPGDRFF